MSIREQILSAETIEQLETAVAKVQSAKYMSSKTLNRCRRAEAKVRTSFTTK